MNRAGPRVVLVGLPGTGKSAAGRRLAKILAVPFADTDDLVEQATGRTVAQVFAGGGEAAFRAVEAEVVAEALASFGGVLALGGGALTTAATRERLAASGAPVALLDAPPAVLLARIGDAGSRPLLRADPAARLAALAAERDPTYRACASFTVDTENRTPGQVAATIAARLHEYAAASR